MKTSRYYTTHPVKASRYYTTYLVTASRYYTTYLGMIIRYYNTYRVFDPSCGPQISLCAIIQKKTES